MGGYRLRIVAALTLVLLGAQYNALTGAVAAADGKAEHPKYCPKGWVSAEFPLNLDLGCLPDRIASNACLYPVQCPAPDGQTEGAISDLAGLGGPDMSNAHTCIPEPRDASRLDRKSCDT